MEGLDEALACDPRKRKGGMRRQRMCLLGHWIKLDLQLGMVLSPHLRKQDDANTLSSEVQHIDECHGAKQRRRIVYGVRGRSWTTAGGSGKGKEQYCCLSCNAGSHACLRKVAIQLSSMSSSNPPVHKAILANT